MTGVQTCALPISDLITYLTGNYYPLSSNPAGYLTSFTETDPIYTASSWYSTVNNSANWNTAYSWGNHALAGYLTQTLADTLYYPLSSNPAGYLTSYTETDPVFTAWLATPPNVSIFTNDVGYLTSIPSLQDVTNVGNTTTNYIEAAGFYTNYASTQEGVFAEPGFIGVFRLGTNYPVISVGSDKSDINAQRIDLISWDNTLSSPVIKLRDADQNNYNIYRIFNAGLTPSTFNLALPNDSGTFILSINGNYADDAGNITISTGSGTVTSVQLSAGTGISLSGTNPITTSEIGRAHV